MADEPGRCPRDALLMHISRLVDPLVHEIGAAVLDPAILLVARRTRLLLAEADGLDSVFGNAQQDQRALDRVRAPLTESQVVLMPAPLVAMPWSVT